MRRETRRSTRERFSIFASDASSEWTPCRIANSTAGSSVDSGQHRLKGEAGSYISHSTNISIQLPGKYSGYRRQRATPTRYYIKQTTGKSVRAAGAQWTPTESNNRNRRKKSDQLQITFLIRRAACFMMRQRLDPSQELENIYRQGEH